MQVVLLSLLLVSLLSARMKEARGAGTSHISILWVFDKILQCLELSRAKHCPVYAVELSNEIAICCYCFVGYMYVYLGGYCPEFQPLSFAYTTNSTGRTSLMSPEACPFSLSNIP